MRQWKLEIVERETHKTFHPCDAHKKARNICATDQSLLLDPIAICILQADAKWSVEYSIIFQVKAHKEIKAGRLESRNDRRNNVLRSAVNQRYYKLGVENVNSYIRNSTELIH